MVVLIDRGSAPVNGVTVKLSTDEAKMLRRACYYNKTVASKFRDNPVGGSNKARSIDSFLGILGSKLKDNGIARF